jgi:NAD(P)-dependent dehydrogenase (short-subunit alcohol dehydrogenase family)
MSLSGKRIAVTGADGALGSAMVRVALASGARVVALDRTDLAAQSGIEGLVTIGKVDLTKTEDTQRAFSIAAERLGGLDGLVNIAGSFKWEKLAGGSVEVWDQLYAVNLRTAVNATRAALPFLTHPGGRVVNVGAMAANHAGTGMGAYAASKSGVARLTEALAEELKDQGVTVNAVLPSTIDTPQNRTEMPKSDFTRWVKPEALAGVIVFLLSDAASVITGALIPVAGRV